MGRPAVPAACLLATLLKSRCTFEAYLPVIIGVSITKLEFSLALLAMLFPKLVPPATCTVTWERSAEIVRVPAGKYWLAIIVG